MISMARRTDVVAAAYTTNEEIILVVVVIFMTLKSDNEAHPGDHSSLGQ